MLWGNRSKLHSRCLGGKLTDIHGDLLEYHGDVQRMNSAGVLAVAPEINLEQYAKTIPQQLKEGLPKVMPKKN